MDPVESNPMPLSSPEGGSVKGVDDPALILCGPGRIWMSAILAGFAAGLIAWLGGEACLEAFQAPRHSDDSMRVTLQVTTRSGEAARDAKNAGLAFAILGGVFGGSLGAAGGLARRSSRQAFRAALIGLVIGASSAVCTSFALLPVYNSFKLRNPDEASKDMLYPLLVHGGIWIPIGAAGGLAFARGLGIRGLTVGAAMGGMIGATFATILYELIGAALAPEALTTQFVSTTLQTRLFARLAVTLLAAAGVAWAVSGQRIAGPARSISEA